MSRALEQTVEVVDGDIHYSTEAVYWRHRVCYANVCESVDEAVSMLCYGSDNGECAPVGVFVNGEPVLTGDWWDEGERHPPSVEEAEKMMESYRMAHRYDER